ncbi:MAG: phosphoribosylanthranilate isomerase [Eubacteriales bacterium]|nr:phosphoribosylanthranilate isomerase [Bacillota bacterium]MDP3049776.1 phosphoribosylanthranilate isomerase [Eubacteriales bacterium]MDQ7788430.1 phosphoribosylanthranilate isomerase [Clostridia bacterium]MDZ4042120.1 phosphoribosylanthranilate isomerase [Eubacteriales bacterium]MDZ7609794.1 phosphoribosylanthranilate isomerase [Eubacteriales bacterium]
MRVQQEGHNASVAPWVKICGLSDRRTALAAADAGADALGFVFAPSQRQVTPEVVREIVRILPETVTAVGVFMDQPLEYVLDTAAQCNLGAVQLHGSESPDYCREIKLPVIKSFPLSLPYRVEDPRPFNPWAVLLDSAGPGGAGGTGKTLDWQKLRQLDCGLPLILAGGLNPDNVTEAVNTVRPFGVDVSSGVETDRRKDIEKIRAFVLNARL